MKNAPETAEAEVNGAKVIPDARSFADAALILGAMGEPARLQILWCLGQGEQSTSDLCDRTGLRQERLSDHITVLKLRQLVTGGQKWRYTPYRLTDSGREAVDALTRFML